MLLTSCTGEVGASAGEMARLVAAVFTGVVVLKVRSVLSTSDASPTWREEQSERSTPSTDSNKRKQMFRTAKLETKPQQMYRCCRQTSRTGGGGCRRSCARIAIGPLNLRYLADRQAVHVLLAVPEQLECKSTCLRNREHTHTHTHNNNNKLRRYHRQQSGMMLAE